MDVVYSICFASGSHYYFLLRSVFLPILVFKESIWTLMFCLVRGDREEKLSKSYAAVGRCFSVNIIKKSLVRSTNCDCKEYKAVFLLGRKA